MFRQSPSRNQRSKGFRIKHGLQIFLLLAICFWLLYQVKHSHDKKKAFDESSLKLSEKTHSEHDIVKLGRKGLHPQLEEKSSDNEISSKDEVVEGDEEDEENKPEEEEEENKPVKGEKSKHDEVEVEEEEEEENKPEENEEEGRGAGDDEIDEQDQEVAEEEAENGENSIDEDEKDGKEGTEEGEDGEDSIDRDEKDRKEGTEEGENKEKAKEAKDEGLSDDQDHDRNTQEAREVNYKGDDASSAVLRETQVGTTEAESGNLGDSTEKKLVKNTEKDTLDLDDKTNSMENSTSSHDIPKDKMVFGDVIEGNNSSNLKTTEEKEIEGNTSTNFKTSEENRIDELQTNSTITKSDALPVVNNSSMAEEVHPSNSLVQNRTHITSGSIEDTIRKRATDNGGESKLLSTNQAESSNVTMESEKSISNNRISIPIGSADVTKGEFSDTSNNDVTVAMEEQTLKSSSTVDEEKSSLSSTTNANVKVGATEGTEEASITIENAADETQSLSNESNNLVISQEETGLGTLAKSETEGMKGDNVAAE